ncbi:hypothetical protein ACFQ3Z_31340 [Streptomyces nogalater]
MDPINPGPEDHGQAHHRRPSRDPSPPTSPRPRPCPPAWNGWSAATSS